MNAVSWVIRDNREFVELHSLPPFKIEDSAFFYSPKRQEVSLIKILIKSKAYSHIWPAHAHWLKVLYPTYLLWPLNTNSRFSLLCNSQWKWWVLQVVKVVFLLPTLLPLLTFKEITFDCCRQVSVRVPVHCIAILCKQVQPLPACNALLPLSLFSRWFPSANFHFNSLKNHLTSRLPSIWARKMLYRGRRTSTMILLFHSK